MALHSARYGVVGWGTASTHAALLSTLARIWTLSNIAHSPPTTHHGPAIDIVKALAIGHENSA